MTYDFPTEEEIESTLRLYVGISKIGKIFKINNRQN